MRNLQALVCYVLGLDVVLLRTLFAVFEVFAGSDLRNVAVMVSKHLVEKNLLLLVPHFLDDVRFDKVQVPVALRKDVPLELLLELAYQ